MTEHLCSHPNCSCASENDLNYFMLFPSGLRCWIRSQIHCRESGQALASLLNSTQIAEISCRHFLNELFQLPWQIPVIKVKSWITRGWPHVIDPFECDTHYHFLCACWCFPLLQACSGKVLTLGESHLSHLLSTVWEIKVPSIMRPWTNKIIYCEMLLRKNTD